MSNRVLHIFCVGCALTGALCGGCATVSPPQRQESTVVADVGPDADVRNHQVHALEVRVRAMPDGPEREYFSGILAGRSGRFDESILLLNRALPAIRESEPMRAAIALEALAHAYTAKYRYGDAARAYGDLAEHFAGQMDRFPADDAGIARILSETPAQTIAWQGPVRLRTSTNPIGSQVTELAVNGTREQWLLDTGANQSVVSRSFAERLGLTPLPGTARAGSGLTGLQSSIQVAVLPILPLGGATLQNVVLVILDDANLKIGASPHVYQIHAILGYPVLAALGRITFTRDGEFRAGGAVENSVSSTRMFLRGVTPAIECEVEGQPLLFTFDTGASSTGLSVRYYEQFKREAGSWKKRRVESGGAGGSVTQEVYLQRRVVMTIGSATVTLKDVSILRGRMNAGIDVLFGNLGQDVVAGFESFTLDFSNMTLSLGAPVEANSPTRRRPVR